MSSDPVRDELLMDLAEAEGQLINAASRCGDARRRLEEAESRIEEVRMQIQIHDLTKVRNV